MPRGEHDILAVTTRHVGIMYRISHYLLLAVGSTLPTYPVNRTQPPTHVTNEKPECRHSCKLWVGSLPGNAQYACLRTKC